MNLRLYEDSDLELTRQLETDPAVMTHLGGPQDDEAILKAHERRTSPVEGGDWWFVIEVDGAEAGTIGVWPDQQSGNIEHEVGWMIVPDFQGRGVATEALSLLLSRIRADTRFKRVHAHPGASNEASNALCRRAGFDLLGEETVDYRGKPFHCNHWVLEV
jgi:RimJ/RimL family protein N-acetyltransferase